MQYTISNPGGGGDGGEEEGGGSEQQAGTANIKVGGMSCSGDCSSIQQIDGTKTFNATLTAPNVAAGETKDVSVQVTATINGETGTASQTITVKGADKPTSVTRVSGKIKDADGKKIAGVAVAMRDAAGHAYDATTNSDGSYSFISSDSNPIEAGNITVGALKEGYSSTTVTVQGTAGKSVNVPITLKKLAAESPSPEPSTSVSASAVPTEEATDDETEEATDETAAPVATDPVSDESEGGTNWLLIIMGILLVAAGIGAIVLVVMRRKNSGGDGPDGSPAGPAGPQPGGNAFDATRVASPVGAGRGGDATMVAPMGGGQYGQQGGGIGDAPTMVHRPVVEDEFPDPYGAPMPPQGGYNGSWGNDQGAGQYGGQQQQYGQQQQGYGGYDQQQGYGGYDQQQGYGGYDQQQGYGGYEQQQAPQQRYDEHTSMYQPEQPQAPQQRYDEHTSLYQPEQQGGYADQGYGQQQQPGYGQQQPHNGYDEDPDGYGNYGRQRPPQNWNG